MGAEAPQWLFSSFAQAMEEIGATASKADLEREARELVGRWSEPGRHLHNLRHLINVLAYVDELSATAHDPEVLRVATWYHGAVLNKAVEAALSGSDPESVAQSCADLTAVRLVNLGVSQEVAERVSELIKLMSKHVAPRDDVDAQVLIDADLAHLAASPQDYKKYRKMIREEFPHVDDLTFLRARRVVIRRLLAKPAVFQSPIGQAWEQRARENLEAELANVDEAIAKMAPEDQADVEGREDIEQVERVEEALDLGDGATVTETGTIIIRRKHLKKSNGGVHVEEPATTTRVLTTLAPVEEEIINTEDDDLSTLESAIDAIDVPSRPKPAE